MLKDKIYLTAFIMTLLSVPLGHMFAMDFQASIVWPTLGIVFAFVYRFGQKVYIPLFSGMFIGYFYSNIMIIEYNITAAFIIAFLFTWLTFFAVNLGTFVMNRFEINQLISFKTLFVYLLATLCIVLVSSTFGTLIIYFQGSIEFSEFMSHYFIWFMGDTFSLLIFGIGVILAFEFDECLIDDLKQKKHHHEIIFYLILLFFSFTLFDERIPFITYESHKFLFFPFAIYASYYFPHRAYYIGSLLFIIAMAFFPPFHLTDVSAFYFMFDVNLFLLFVGVMFFALKIIFIKMNKEIMAMETTKSRRETLVNSMDSLFTLSSDMITTDSLKSEQQAIKTFRIIFDLFDIVDYGACMINENGKISWIDTVGFDKDLLNAIKSDAHEFKGGLSKPLVVNDAEKWIEKDFGDAYDIYQKHNPPIKESILMSVKISEKFNCEMSFDIAEGSDESFTTEIVEYFDALNILLNGFYESQVISYQYDERKTSMVMSLLKIIELFDKQTYEHSRDVADMTKRVAQTMGYNHEILNRLYWAGIVHDIGKIGIDKKIVNKPDILTISEYETIKEHVMIGYDLLNKSESLQLIASYVYHHHERYDGSGYPKGTKGDELPFENYILNICEVVATMARGTNYQSQFKQKDIVAYLNKERDKAWPEKLIDVMIELINDDLLEMFYKK